MRSLMVAGLLCFVLVPAVSATAPHLVSFQGRLTDAARIPVTDSTYSVTFSIYSGPAGGPAIWSEIQNVSTWGGLFNVLLGSVTPLDPATVSGDSSRYLGIQIGGDPEISPRTRLASVPFAFSAADGGTTPGGWTDDGNAVRLTTSSDRVGIGTSTPFAKLEISGKGTDGKSFNANDVLTVIPDSPFVGINRDFKVIPQEVFGVHSPRSGYGGMFMSVPTLSDVPFYGYSAGGFLHAYHYYDAGTKTWSLWNSGGTRLTVDSIGHVGINPSGFVYPWTLLSASLRIFGDSTGPSLLTYNHRHKALEIYSDVKGIDITVPLYADSLQTGYPRGVTASVASGIWPVALNGHAWAGSEHAWGVLGDADGAPDNVGVVGRGYGPVGDCYGVVGTADNTTNRSTGGYFSGDEIGVSVEVGSFGVPTSRTVRTGVQVAAYGDGANTTYGVGAQGTKGQNVYGVAGYAGAGSVTNYGVAGGTTGGAVSNYGVYATAVGGSFSGTNFGMYAKAQNGAVNYAGYFSKGSPGAVTPAANSIVVMETGGHGYLSILAPDANEKGVLFGQPSNEAAGGMVYNAGGVPDGLSFRTLNNSTKMVITSGGLVGINTTSPSQRLSVNGNICYTGSIGACSDARYKTDVSSLAGALDHVVALRAVNYRWNRDAYPEQNFDEQMHIGFIAQELEEVYPEVVITDSAGYRSVDYSRLTPILVEAIQELKVQKDEEIDELKKQINELRAIVAGLEAKSNVTESALGMK